MGAAERHRRSTTAARCSSARDRRRLGRADRKGRRVRVPQRQTHARVAEAEAPQAAGVRHRRVDRAAAVPLALRRAAASVTTTRAAVCDGLAASARGSIRRSSIASRRCSRSGRSRRAPFADAFKTMEPAHWVRPDLVVADPIHGVDERRVAAPAGVPRPSRRTRIAKEVAREEPASPRPSTPRIAPSRMPHRRNRRDSSSGPVIEQLAALEKTRGRTVTSRCRTATRCASRISRRCSGRSSASRRASCCATTRRWRR